MKEKKSNRSSFFPLFHFFQHFFQLLMKKGRKRKCKESKRGEEKRKEMRIRERKERK